MTAPAETPDALPRPRLIGRTVRTILAALLLATLVNLLRHAPGFLRR